MVSNSYDEGQTHAGDEECNQKLYASVILFLLYLANRTHVNTALTTAVIHSVWNAQKLFTCANQVIRYLKDTLL